MDKKNYEFSKKRVIVQIKNTEKKHLIKNWLKKNNQNSIKVHSKYFKVTLNVQSITCVFKIYTDILISITTIFSQCQKRSKMKR